MLMSIYMYSHRQLVTIKYLFIPKQRIRYFHRNPSPIESFLLVISRTRIYMAMYYNK